MIAMADAARLGFDAAAVLLITFALYFPRHRRRDMVLALVTINVGVVAVTTVLERADVTAGLGIGLFGVLSIIRLRSMELDQEEVAYYFSAIALGAPVERMKVKRLDLVSDTTSVDMRYRVPS